MTLKDAIEYDRAQIQAQKHGFTRRYTVSAQRAPIIKSRLLDAGINSKRIPQPDFDTEIFLFRPDDARRAREICYF